MAYRSFGTNFEIPTGNLPHGDGYTVGPTGSNADYITDGVADEVQINQAITDAFNSSYVTTVKLLIGTYSVSDTIVMKAGIHLFGEQAGSVKITAATNFNYAGTAAIITAVGTETTSIPINLSANVVDGYNIIQVSTAGSSGTEYGLVANGDYLFLVANVIWDANSEQSVRYTGEYVKVSTKSANSFTIHGMTRSNYNTVDSARLYRMSFLNNVTISNIEITQSSPIKTISNAGNCIILQKTYNAVVKNCILHDFDGAGVGLWNVVKVGIYNTQMYNLTDDPTDGYFGYGIVCGGSSEQINIAENTFDYIRHALTTGYPAKVSATLDGYGISRNVNFIGNTVTRATNSAIDTHAQSDGINISNNSISSCITYGIFTRGIGTHIMNNDIEWCGAGISVGISPQSSGGSGSGTTIVGNTIKHMTVLSATTTNGIISGSGIGINLTQTDNVIVSGNTIDGCDAQGIFLNIYVKNCIVQDNVIMNTNVLNSSNIGAIGLGGSGAGTGTLAFSTPTVTLTTTGSPFNTNFFAGQVVKITGATNAGNNGTFTITAVPTANTIQWSNASGVAGDSVTYVIECISDCYLVNNTAINTPASRYDATVTGHAKYLIFDSGTTGTGGNVRNTFKNNTGFNMESGLFNFQNTTSFFAGNSSTESTPVKNITSAADDGYFQSVPQAGTMAINTATGASYIRTNSTNTYNELVTIGTDILTSPIRFDKSISLPTISQATNITNGATATDMLIVAQPASGTTSTGGNLQLRTGTGTTANGMISMRAGGNTFMNFLPGGTNAGVGNTQIQVSGNATSFTLSHVVNGATTTNGAIFLVQAQGTGSFADGYTGGTLRLSPGITSSPTNGTGGSMLLDAPFGLGTGANGTIQIRGSTTTVFTISPSLTVASATGIAQIQVAAANAGFNINQADKVTNSGTGAPLTIQAQNETGTTSTGGALNLTSGTGTTVAGNVVIKTGTTTRITVAPTLVTVTPSIQINGGGTSPAAADGYIRLPYKSNMLGRSSNDTKNLQVFSTSSWINPPFNSPTGLQEILSIGSDWDTFTSTRSFDVTSISANNYVILTTTNISGLNNLFIDDYQTGIAPSGSLRIGSGASSTLFNWADYGDGYGVMRFGDAPTVPTINASSGVIVYSASSGLNINGSYLAIRPNVATAVATQGTLRSSIESSSFIRNTANTKNLGVYATSTFGFNPIYSHNQDALLLGTDENGDSNKTFDVTYIYANDFISLSTTAAGSGMTVEANQTLINAHTNFAVCGTNFGPVTSHSTFGDGYGVFYLGEAYALPSSNPPSGVIFYVDSGIAKVRQADGTIIPIVSSGSVFTPGGDLTGSSSSQQVISLTGSGGTVSIASTGASLSWISTAVTPTLRQNSLATNGATGQTLTIQSQNATGTTSTGGSLILKSGTGTTIDGYILFQTGTSSATIAQVTSTKFVSSKGRRHHITTITGTYTVLTTDEYVIVTTNAAAFTITLPASPVTGDTYEIKDGVGNAAANNLTIAGNGKNIDGAANYMLTVNYGAVLIAYNGTEWSIL